MDDIASQPASASIHDKVRKAAPATMIGAALMLYFGYLHLGQPSGDDLFHRAALVLYYTLRIGGIAFAGISLLLYLGWIGALVLDAALALPTGAILIACGVAMMLDHGDGVNSIILILCGASFLSSGWRNAQEYKRIRRLTPSPFQTEDKPCRSFSVAGRGEGQSEDSGSDFG
jgi:hypothetical protein